MKRKVKDMEMDFNTRVTRRGLKNLMLSPLTQRPWVHSVWPWRWQMYVLRVRVWSWRYYVAFKAFNCPISKLRYHSIKRDQSAEQSAIGSSISFQLVKKRRQNVQGFPNCDRHRRALSFYGRIKCPSCTGMVKKPGPRLREPIPGNQNKPRNLITQPRAHLFEHAGRWFGSGARARGSRVLQDEGALWGGSRRYRKNGETEVEVILWSTESTEFLTWIQEKFETQLVSAWAI